MTAPQRRPGGRWRCAGRVLCGLLPGGAIGIVLGALLIVAAAARAAGTPSTAIEPATAKVLADTTLVVPADSDPRWAVATLPDSRDVDVAWYRVEFDVPAAAADELWMLYLPYFYGGGRVWANGKPVAALVENSARLRVRWERPQLLPLPQNTLRVGRNVLHLRAVSAHAPSGMKLPQLVIGPQQALQPQFDRRLFFVRTVPVVTVVTGVVVGLCVIFIWFRRRQEVQYGLFGAAALLWALRTTTFTFDALPAELWSLWRLLYHAGTGGFIVVLAMFALDRAGWLRRPWAVALTAYGLLGPLLYLVAGRSADEVVGRWWSLGLAPIGLGVAVVSLVTAWRRRSVGSIAIAAAVMLAALAGVHDYAVAWSAPWLETLWPRWAGHRIFLLHHAANAMLVVMGALLTMRFVRSLHAVEEANRTLEARVADREREIAASYARIAELQREQATQDERQRIVQDLHDGLGAQLFNALLRAERGTLEAPEMALSLRGAIDAMRIAIEALAPEDGDFRTAFGNFRFRWEPRLRDAGLATRWQVDLPDAVPLGPHDALQCLHIVQEALTNVLKHARARRADVSLRLHDGRLLIEVADDGIGAAPARTDADAVNGAGKAGPGRGRANMQARAARVHGTLQIESAAGGTRVSLSVPLPASQSAAAPQAAAPDTAQPA